MYICIEGLEYGGNHLRFSYNKLFKLLIDRNIKKKELREMSGVSATSIAKLGTDANVNTDVLLRICNALQCDVGDIMEFVNDEPAGNAKAGTTSNDFEKV